MKKALLILLALTMMMSTVVIAPISASAADEEAAAIGSVAADYKPEGTAIATAEDFAAMAADGKYYLSADITVSASYEKSFTGTFDGNGHTINTTATLFLNLNGTVKNLTIEGSLTDSETISSTAGESINAVLARRAATEGNTVIENVCNKASMTSKFNGMASMVGFGGAASGNTLTITNCANYGSITVDFGSSNKDSGGILGIFNGTANCDLVIDGCVNYGTINASGRPGGITGCIKTSAKIINCENNGAVQAIDNYAGGIASRLGENNNLMAECTFIVENCVNNGAISYKGGKDVQLGGIVGYLGAAKTMTFKNCTNNGAMTAVDHGDKDINIGGIVAGGHNKNVEATNGTITFENCVNNGEINVPSWTTKARGAGIAGLVTSQYTAVFNNCVNNADVTVVSANKENRVGGIVGYNKYAIVMNNCINNGDIESNHTAGHAGGLIGYQDSTSKKNMVLTGCGNTGDISGYQAAGLVAYQAAAAAYGAEITYCFTNGDVTGDKWAAGLVAYLNAGTGKVAYSYVGGKITCGEAPTDVKSDDTVAEKIQYTFNYDGTDYYFYAPVKGTVMISGKTVTIGEYSKALAAATAIDAGEDAKAKTVYKVGSLTFISDIAGKVEVSGETVKVGGKAAQVLTGNITVYDHNVGARAILWSNHMTMNDIDLDTIYVEEGCAGIDYIMGAGNLYSGITSSNAAKKLAHSSFASGEVAYKLNQAAGKEVFYQNLISTIFVVDEYPTTDSTHARVIESAGKYTNLLLELNPDCTPSTGDATIYVVVALGVSALALGGLVVAKKKKVRN